MIRSMKDFVAEMKRDIERWKKKMNAAETAGFPQFADQFRRWITEGRKIIADSGL
jgi:hypothetical protein